MWEIKENILCFQYMFFYILVIISLIYLGLVLKNFPEEDSIESLKQVMDYWKKKPIWKMEILTSKETVEPKGMEKYSVGEWRGTIEGCNCTDIYNNYNFFLKGSCSNINSGKKCINVKEQDPINIYYYYFRYYVTYYDSDYLTLFSRVEKNENDKKCKKGYKKCGFLDNSLNPFCVKEEEDCVANRFYFKQEGTMINVWYGFGNNLVNSNIAINNLFVLDNSGSILNENYLNDENILYKNKTNKIWNKLEHFKNLTHIIPDSEMTKYTLYKFNNIFNGDGLIGKKSYNSNTHMYAMIYYGLNNSLSDYNYFDAFLFKNLKLNHIIFLILKVLIQFGYYIFMQKAIKQKQREIIYNSIWTISFIFYFLFIWMINNSFFRSAQLISLDFELELYKVIKIFRIIDIILAAITLSEHIFKVIFIITNKNKKRYPQFINQDK